MNGVFYGLVLLACASTLWFQFNDPCVKAIAAAKAAGTAAPGCTPVTAQEVGKAAMESAKSAVEIAIGLVGAITLFLGLMKIVEQAGGLAFMARMIRPVLERLFPDVPPEHPAMGAMIMNLAANVLGLGNAATPFGLKAMKELDELNAEKGTATNAMVLFLAINTSGVAVLPTGVIGLRALKGSVDPASIFSTTLMATTCSTITAIIVAVALSKLPMFKPPEAQRLADLARQAERTKGPPLDLIAVLSLFVFVLSVVGLLVAVQAAKWTAIAGFAGVLVRQVVPRLLGRPAVGERRFLEFVPLAVFFGGLVSLVVLVSVHGEKASGWILPGLILAMLTIGIVRRVRIYEVFVAGAKEGFQLAVGIIPSLLAILVSVGMFRKSGGLEVLTGFFGRFTGPLGLPAEVLPLAFLRPLSGSGAFALTGDLIVTHGPDSYIGQLASTINGSTETTFYVLAVYFGSVGISRTRHAVPTGLAADLMGLIGSVVAVRLLLAH
ncbi:MAG: nucleoside recognition domain-containing protein [Myxococcaceae bacterium]|nr:nucleoside recognition domain-containing protein [Myxococcaceae bacterium]